MSQQDEGNRQAVKALSSSDHSSASARFSCLYQGKVRHRRFLPKPHQFAYSLYMLAIDPDELLVLNQQSKLFGFSWFNPIRFVEKDYLRDDPGTLKNRIKNKVHALGGAWQGEKVLMLIQARCFGIYFSPANFYFCYNQQGQCQYLLAEVSNTPWNERHYYLLDLLVDNKFTSKPLVIDKDFHVSPFMDLAMQYYWKIVPPHLSDELLESKADKLLVHIENRSKTNGKEKIFDATLQMTKQPFTASSLMKVWCQLPMMTIKVFASIYYQALKLWLKKVPFVPYVKRKSNSVN